MKFILDNDLSEFGDTLDFYFTATHETTFQEVDLKPGGSSISVTNDNKHEFARLKT